MIEPGHPFRRLSKAGIGLCGWTPAGRVKDFWMVKAGKTLSAYWDVDAFPGAGWSMVIFANGTFLERTTAKNWTFNAERDQRLYQFDFYLVPRWQQFETWQPRTFNLIRTVTVTWDTTGEIHKVHVYKNDTGQTAINTDDDEELIEYTAPVVSCSDANVTVAGNWKGDAKTATVACEITNGGTLDQSTFTWTYEGEESDPIILRSYPQLLFNGITAKFADTTYTYGATFDIEIRLPETYTTDPLANGKHRFQIGTFKNNLRTLSSDVEEITISAVPGSAVLDTDASTYTDGTGTAVIAWTMPAETGVRQVWIFRNYPADGLKDLHWRPVQVIDVQPGETIQVTVDDLQEGTNRVCPRVLNDGEFNEDLQACYELVLDSSLNELATEPGPPWGIRGEQQSDLSVTLWIQAEEDSTQLNVYIGDSSGGAIDYSSVFATVTNPQRVGVQNIESKGWFFPEDGTYRVGVRAQNASLEEDNTTVFNWVVVDSTLAAEATNLALALAG